MPAARSRGRERLVDRARQVRQHDDRLVGVGRQPLEGPRERDSSPSYSAHQVDGQRDHVHGSVVGQRGQAVGEQVLGAGAAAPDVERVGRLQPGVEQRGQPRGRGRRQRRERDAEPLGHVGDQHPLGAGVVHRRDPARAAAGRTRRPIAKVSRLSASSSRSSQRCTPYAANSASHAGVRRRRARRSGRRPAPARAPSVPDGERAPPGCRASAASASAARSRGASRIVSSTSPTTRVSRQRRARRRGSRRWW